MQFATQILQGNWTEPTGWLLIIAGLALATSTLGKNSRLRLGPVLGGPLLGPWPRQRQPKPIDRGSEWERLVDIIDSGSARAEALVVAQACAVEAIEAADDAMSQLLAELMPSAAATLPQGRELEPTPAPAARPLAA